jgi:hypothetical protein
MHQMIDTNATTPGQLEALMAAIRAAGFGLTVEDFDAIDAELAESRQAQNTH